MTLPEDSSPDGGILTPEQAHDLTNKGSQLQPLSDTAPRKIHVISPRQGLLDFVELWEFRELLFALVARDYHVRYRQSLLGVAWVVIQPLVIAVVTTLAFSRAAHFASDGVPYPLFALAALVPWNYFSRALTQSSECLITNRHVLTKVYFPRLLLPVAAILSGLLDCAIGFVVLLLMMVVYRFPVHAGMLAVPLLILLLMLTVLGAGMWLAPLNALYRDFQALLPFLLQVGLFATPIVYSSSMLPARWRPFYVLNPLVFIVDGLRWAVFGVSPPSARDAVLSLAVIVLLLSTGLQFFLRTENSFVDLV